MSTNKTFIVKNGLTVGATTVIDSAGLIDFALLKNKPTTIAGFGITDALSSGAVTTSSVTITNGTGTAILYNDTNVNNFVVRVGGSSATKYMVVDASGNLSTPGTVSSGGGVLAVAANVIPHTGSARFHDMAAGGYGSDYGNVALQIREYNYQGSMSGETAAAPRIAFHWGSRVASQFGMNGSGWLTCWNNPGSGYENLLAKDGLFTGDVTAFYSDMRLKTKVKDIDNALDIIRQLNGFYYEDNDLARSLGYDNEGLQIGLSAQDVQKVLPELVSQAPFDMAPDPTDYKKVISKTGENYMTVNYARVVPVVVEAVKQQDETISLLLQEIKELKLKVAALEAK